MSTASWVIGGGLLGGAVLRQLGHGAMHHPIRWADSSAAIADLHSGLIRLVSMSATRIEIYWCAGRAVTSSPQVQVDEETRVYRAFMQTLERLGPQDRSRLAVFLASSVGGAYGSSPSPPFTESSPTRPSSHYGEAKLAMETSLSEATRRGQWRSFIARITNLYGPGQDLTKGQGLLSVIAASYIQRRPMTVSVSLDTLRDYIYEDDGAGVIVAGTRRVASAEPGTTVTKIVGAMAAQSVGAILGENRRLRGSRTPAMLRTGSGTGQASDLRVRSEVWTDLDALVRTTLPEGLDRLYRAQLAAFADGRLRA